MDTTSLTIAHAAWSLDGYIDETEPMRHVVISVNPFRIGRSPELALSLRCRTVSKLHAEIIQRDGGLWIKDLGSTNGTFINGKRVTEAEPLNEGDLVQFGKIILHVNQKRAE